MLSKAAGGNGKRPVTRQRRSEYLFRAEGKKETFSKWNRENFKLRHWPCGWNLNQEENGEEIE